MIFGAKIQIFRKSTIELKKCHFWRENSNETILMIFIQCDEEDSFGKKGRDKERKPSEKNRSYEKVFCQCQISIWTLECYDYMCSTYRKLQHKISHKRFRGWIS